MAYAIALIVSASIFSRLVGFLWYHPRVFGATWVALSHLTPEIAEHAQKYRTRYSLLSYVASLGVALTLSLLFSALSIDEPLVAASFGALLWAGIVVPATLGDVLWQQKPLKLYTIDAGYWLLSIIVMSMVVAL
jgi:hypothetical protein